MATLIHVKLYRTKDGRTPFRTWITSLRDVDGRNRINAKITGLKLGNTSNCEPVGEGVSELKIDFGPGYRVYFAKRGKSLIILLCGSDKDDQHSAIKQAKKYWADYKSRHTQ
ncbi:MAG TPA: type II toxin-antitoxin system RelE/ParE family toxin [Pyrinomonadaceae bacterium]